MAIGRITTEGELARFVDAAIDPLRTLIKQLQSMLDGRRLKIGVAAMTWPGGVSLSDTVTVDHGLPAAPEAVLATMILAGSGEVWAVHAGNYTDASFDLQAEPVSGFTPPAATTVPVAWMAVV